jgi:hypothetical protein
MELLQHPPFDALIPYHEKDAEILPYCIDSLQKNIKGIRNIYIISNDDPEVDEAIWIPESSFPFTIEDAGTIIKSTNGREGWYYQQLLKLYAPTVIKDLLNYFLIVDSDVVFLRPVDFFKGETPLFDYGGMYVPSYFEHMQRVLPDEFKDVGKESGTTDCMMYRKDILSDMFNRIERKHECPAWQALLKQVAPDRYNLSGMSEQDLYFHYALLQYPGLYELRLLEKERGVYLNELKRTDVDFISFHAWFRDWQRGFTKADS